MLDDHNVHSAIIQISYELHEIKSDGKYDPAIKDQGALVVELRGQDRGLCEAKLKEFVSLIKDVHYADRQQGTRPDAEPSTIESSGTRPQETQVQGLSQRGRTPTLLLGLRQTSPDSGSSPTTGAG